ncbi:helix-turn-helix transcriptional regulator [Pyxidicoccus parkwayensis]|uniref:Helix-turn-helix transcriptional regulator n=1 Tax=Pyxidicoccus parkwayensis TaxID=2813578 RepID=A0ABX7NWK3_9BACT|nr:helix-turn-helix transcriptional regulator [Pyxidicoccus parkwaysis]QSQ23262.1 helix-turn-helix transcriptional regulator [Pyxidicoccus parkwaysis]
MIPTACGNAGGACPRALHLATTSQSGQFDLFDYLCRTASNLGEELALASRHLRLARWRGLRRRLQAEGRTFREVVEALRLEKARHLLAEDSLNVAGIAQRVGYSDARALRRAFQRWTGMSPGRYRRSPPSV